MLILTRTPDNNPNPLPEIIIDDNILVKMLEPSSDGRMRIGILAPKEIPVNRKELTHVNHT